MKKIKRIITSLMLVMAVCICSIQPAFAATHDTWKANTSYDYGFTFTDDNLTPYKTCRDAGDLVISGSFKKADTGSSNIKLKAQLRAYPSGAILDETVVYNYNYPHVDYFMLSAHVSAGQKVQIYFDASSINNPPGFYRKAKVSYTAFIAQ